MIEEAATKPAHPETVYIPFRSYIVAITGDPAPLNPDKSPKELLVDKKVKMLLLDTDKQVLGSADRFSYQAVGKEVIHKLASPLTNLQCLAQTLENVATAVV